MATNVKSQATEEEDDPWATSSGMPDNFTAYIHEPFFGVDEKYNPDALLFCAELVDEEGEPITTLKYSVGQDWEANDDGTEITHPTRSKVNEGSRFGRFIDRIAKPTDERAPKSKDVIVPTGESETGLGLGPTLRKRGTPLQAKSFDGLGFRWRQHTMTTMGTDDKGKPVTRQVLLPVEYVGVWADKNGGKTTAVAPKGATKSAAPKEEAEEGGSDLASQIPITLRKKLTQQAQSSPQKEFLKAAAKNGEVIALPDEVMAFVLGSSASGFWASVQE